ncbi:RNA polymerase subunit sigma-54 [Deltaproteobacteria bacterium]|nr:RNA polymerase subunit sigma-54 [Deltaproteobacteria bacterium]
MHRAIDCDDIMDHLPTALIVCDAAGKILRCNRSAETIFGLDERDGLNIFGIMPDAKWKQALQEGKTAVLQDGILVPLFLRKEKDCCILHSEMTEAGFAARRELFQKQEYAGELSELFDNYIDENIWVSDGSGKIIFVSAAIANKLGIPRENLIGRYVQDLEKELVFSPSVTAEVLRNNQQSAVLQRTVDGRLCVAVGIPFFDNDGNIQKIISVSRDCSNQIAISAALVHDNPIGASADPDDIFAGQFITQNMEMRKMLHIAKLVAPTDSTILIEGESGVGKTLLAKLIHEASNRSAASFLGINCAVISESLFESELFGYAAGSFTGADTQGKAGLIETTQGGTLFLDELGEMPLSQQVKLLEVIQERCIKRIGSTEPIDIDVRIICAAKNKLEELVTASKFRADLFYRLNVVTLHIPPLRNRREDIPHLIRHLAARINANYGLNKSFSPAAIEQLCRYDYPGNVRELAHVLEQAMVTTAGRKIDVAGLPEKLRSNSAWNDMDDVSVPAMMPLASALEQTEKQLLQLAREKYVMKGEIASALGISKATLWRKMQKYGLAET